MGSLQEMLRKRKEKIDEAADEPMSIDEAQEKGVDYSAKLHRSTPEPEPVKPVLEKRFTDGTYRRWDDASQSWKVVPGR